MGADSIFRFQYRVLVLNGLNGGSGANMRRNMISNLASCVNKIAFLLEAFVGDAPQESGLYCERIYRSCASRYTRPERVPSPVSESLRAVRALLLHLEGHVTLSHIA